MGSSATTLEGRVALVTGGASGLGRATCMVLAEASAKVIVADINVDGASATAKAINSHGPTRAWVEELDITSADSRQEVLDDAFDFHGASFDILVNVAGIDKPGYLHDFTPSAFELVNQVNYLGPTHLMQGFLQGVLKYQRERRADIVNVISLSAITVGAGAIAYNSSKAAFAMATQVAQRDVQEYSYPCRVQGIMPAAMNTPMMEQWGIAEDKMMDPTTVAKEILHLLALAPGVFVQNTILTSLMEPNWPR